MQNIAARIAELDQLHELLAGLSHKKNSQLLYGTEGSARHLVMAAVRQATGRPLLIVTPDALQAGKVYEDLTAVFGEDDVWLYPGKDLLYYHDLYSASGETPARRIAVLAQLAGKKRPIVVTTVSGLVAKMCPPGPWQEGCLTLQTGEEIPPEKLLVKLIGVGYERVELVEVRGQVSVRGGIMDIFPMAEEQPVRIEYFGDQIESVRRFDPVTQRSLETVEFLLITPALEVICGEKERRRALSLLAEEKVKLAAKNNRLSRKMLARLEELYAQIRENIYFTGMEQNLLYFYEQPVSLAEWFPADALFFLSDPLRCAQAAEQLDHELGEIKSSLFAQGELLTQQVDLTWPYEEVLGRIKLQTVAFSLFAHQGRPVPYRKSISLSAKPVPRFQGQWQLFTHEITQWRRQHYSIVVLTGSRQRSLNVSDILAADGIPATFARSAADLQPKTVTLLRGSLDSGFILPEAKLAVLTEQDLLPQRKKSRRIKGKEGIRIGDYQELAVGDYVVHEQHGIGQYLGLRTLEVGGTERDYIYIQYAGNDKLYLPVEQIDLVRKYIGVEGKKPKLSALGGGEWSRIKARVQASVQELAKELLALYAARETEPGHAFPPDHPWEADFAASFPFEETPDQLQAIAEIKADMQKSRPMDRLLCGDVGYGKTEVALRAAFKAILDGMQAAFLVPTTILAQQHYRTFTERLQGFPVTVGILSRFQSKAEQKATLQGIRDGTIDLVVGTHRLLSKDVRFKSLGLLVIDEEQRFGVRHKEKIKMLKKNVDVLTMTATPIPRTLHLSLAGVRDLSVIDTPPENRYPIQTYVLEYSDVLVREAILREIGRGGQVYFVHNRVQSIDKWAARLARLVPEAKLAVAHGQMPEAQLEEVMIAFLEGEYDVLLSTTIVEAGLDIPNVNTIIIHDADKFGLAQLYQLRGRVGRSNRIAYCYLTYQKDKILTEAAEKRLHAVKEFTELGSGFKIALRDLEIRGAGNILGPEQHGHMLAVGFDMYIKLLEDAIRTYKGTKSERQLPPRVEVQADAYLPASYISDARQKIVFYQKIVELSSVAEVAEAREELSDRYGPLPPPAENLLLVAHLRLLAQELGISSISEEKEDLLLRITAGKFDGNTLLQYARRRQGRLQSAAGRQFVLAFRRKFATAGEKLGFLLERLQELQGFAGSRQRQEQKT